MTTDVDLLVVGAGASATFLLRALQRQPCPPPAIVVLDPMPVAGPGVPYRTPDPRHRMNVRACQLTGDPDDPMGFVAWAARRDLEATPDTFVPRGVYGAYLADLWRSAAADTSTTVRHERAVSLRPMPGGRWVAGTSGGGHLTATGAVLAVGTPPTSAARFAVDPDARATGLVVSDPWEPGALDDVPNGARVLLVGTGLTAVDVAISLTGAGRAATVTAISPSGLLPHRHRHEASSPSRPLPPAPPQCTARALLHWVRAICDGEPNGWQVGLDALRFELAPLWRRLPPAEQARLARLVSSAWTRHRHRMAPEIADLVDELVAGGRFHLARGRVRSVHLTAPGQLVVETISVDGTPATLLADVVVNCAGPPSVHAIDDELIRQLLSDGIVRADHLGLGLDIDADGRAIAADGHAWPNLSVLGALRRGVELEATAIPELRQQAAALASRLER